MLLTYHILQKNKLSYIHFIGGLFVFTALSFFSCQSKLPSEVQQVNNQIPEIIDFNFHVRSILSDRCFSCHGPDDNARKAELRLDIEESAFAKLLTEDNNTSTKERYAIIPHQPFKSEAIKRILSDDAELVMPPPDSKLSLSANEKAILIRWIEQGAAWKPHWAFTKVEKPQVPQFDTENNEEIKNEIDHFILRKLDQLNIKLSPTADKATLLRRVTLDLTGLPPTLEQLDNFLNDQSPDAYERVVNRLLSSSTYGERWAWEWLDAARYADTNGFQGDPTRSMWPWRDWVIKVLNENMPYDEFSIVQLAGDLYPNPTHDQNTGKVRSIEIICTMEKGVASRKRLVLKTFLIE